MSSENPPKSNAVAAVNEANAAGGDTTAKKKPTVLDKNQEKYLKYRHSGEISKEFGRQIARGEDPRCTYPWNRLDIVLRDNRTKVCSDFPTRLPRFDWPSTEDFHKEDQMWNHPFMQKMRGGMGTDDAVPFCDICVRSNKRAIKNYDWRLRAQKETRQLYHAVEADVLRQSYRGNMNTMGEGLCEMRFLKPNGKKVRLFTEPLEFYRRRMIKHRFFQVGRVLQIGLRNALAAPFLAEGNSSYEAADYSPVKGAFMCSVVARFGLEVKAKTLDPAQALPFADNSFDGIWLDGQTLFRMNLDLLFSELKRVLDADGVVHVQEAYGPGHLLKLVLEDPEGNNGRMDIEDILIKYGHGDILPFPEQPEGLGAPYHSLFAGEMTDELMVVRAAIDASNARAALLDSARHNTIGSFFTEKELRRTLRKHALTVDTVMAPQFTDVKAQALPEDAVERLSGDNALLAALGGVAKDPQQSLTDISNYDGQMIFNVFANVSNRKGTTN